MKNSSIILIVSLMLSLVTGAEVKGKGNTDTRIYDLRVQNSTEPLAVEDKHPEFSWKMESSINGRRQISYRILVRREADKAIVWDSGDMRDSCSTGIRYLGVALQPGTAYEYDVTVLDDGNNIHTESSRFETGLMNPHINSWKGADWIGDTSPSLDAASRHMFSISADFYIVKGTTAGFIFGANDFRLSNGMFNEFNLSGENYFKVILDFAGADTDKGHEIRVYRVGYAPGDNASVPIVTINRNTYPHTNLNSIIKKGGKDIGHKLKVYVEDGEMAIVIDGNKLTAEENTGSGKGHSSFSVGNTAGGMEGASRFRLTPLGLGHDYNTFPHLCSVGFAAEAGSDVTYTGYQICGEGQSQNDPLFFGQERYAIFDKLPHIRRPQYRNQGNYVNDIVVINSESKEAVEYVDPSFGGTKLLRNEFSIPSGRTVRKAKLYVSAEGIYNFYINGRKVGEDWFAPGDSQYRETITYQAYDVTELIHNGKNAMGAELFSGWFTGPMTFTTTNFNFFGDSEALLCRLDLSLDDGTTKSVVSNLDGWKSFDGGPVVYGSFFHGERYDARRENKVKGWNTVGYDDSKWRKAEFVRQREWLSPKIVARFDGLVRVRETLTASETMTVHGKDGCTFIYDMGVNMVGVPRIKIPAGWIDAGDTVIIRYAEQLYPGLEGDREEYVSRFGPEGRNIAGHMLYETNRAALNTDFYISSGCEECTISPRSTYRGYRYIQITVPGHSEPLPLENVKGLVLSSCELPTSSYEAVTDSSETGALANRLFKNIQRSQLGNFFTLPTDCPQRNERMGWTGDAQAYSRTATYNADVRNFFRQWMVALRNDQSIGNGTDVPGGIGSTVPTFNRTDAEAFADGTTWAAAVCMVPWQMFSQYGDTRIVEENIEAMMDWLNGMAFYRWSDQYPHLSSRTGGLADWLAMDNGTPPDLVNNAIYIHMMEVTAIMAEAIGRSDYARILRERHDLAKGEWNRAYVDESTGMTKSMDGKIVNTQTSYATPLNFNVFNEDNRSVADSLLVRLAADPNLSGPEPDKHLAANDFYPWSITTGFSGTPNILPALSRMGHSGEAYMMFSCTALPSWLYPVTKGATTMWERWNSYDLAFAEHNANTMNSFNHFALGSVGQWMYEFQLGITTEHSKGEAGYKHFVLQPLAGGDYTSLSGSYESDYGLISCSWTADGKGRMTSYKASIPANSSATLYLPVATTVTSLGSSRNAVSKGISKRNGVCVAVYELQSGNYEFIIGEHHITLL